MFNLMMDRENIPKLLMSFGFFLFFLSALNTSVFYKIGLAFIVLASVVSLFLNRNDFFSGGTGWLVFYFAVLAVFWGHSFEAVLDFSGGGDHILRYLVTALLVVAVARVGVHVNFVFFGIALGCMVTSILAYNQYIEIGRAEGFTNAIRFGNLSLLLGIFSLIYSILAPVSKLFKIFLQIAFLSGLIASLLSLSRGGWLLLVVLPVFIYFILSSFSIKNVFKIFLLVLALVLVCFAFSNNFVGNRIETAVSEFHRYQKKEEGYATTSVGARLEMWELAVKMGLAKPIYGWGRSGSDQARLEYIERGEANASIKRFSHAHNQYLEIWASRGLIGVFGLTFIYIYPFFIFRNWYRRAEDNKCVEMDMVRSLSLCGMSFCIAHFVFGWTDYFINMSLGHNFFACTLVFLFGACCFFMNSRTTK